MKKMRKLDRKSNNNCNSVLRQNVSESDVIRSNSDAKCVSYRLVPKTAMNNKTTIVNTSSTMTKMSSMSSLMTNLMKEEWMHKISNFLTESTSHNVFLRPRRRRLFIHKHNELNTNVKGRRRNKTCYRLHTWTMNEFVHLSTVMLLSTLTMWAMNVTHKSNNAFFTAAVKAAWHHSRCQVWVLLS